MAGGTVGETPFELTVEDKKLLSRLSKGAREAKRFFTFPVFSEHLDPVERDLLAEAGFDLEKLEHAEDLDEASVKAIRQVYLNEMQTTFMAWWKEWFRKNGPFNGVEHKGRSRYRSAFNMTTTLSGARQMGETVAKHFKDHLILFQFNFTAELNWKIQDQPGDPSEGTKHAVVHFASYTW